MGKINIPQEIGVNYHQFGVLLLEDDNAVRIHSIAHKHKNDGEQINMEVLEGQREAASHLEDFS